MLPDWIGEAEIRGKSDRATAIEEAKKWVEAQSPGR